MKFKSSVYTQASGSVGGLTYSHNRGGMYTRARRTPVNTNTAQQQAVRNAVSQLTTAWQNDLDAAQRSAWEVYAGNVPLIGPTGDARNVGGLGMYVRSNVPRLQSGMDRIDDGPLVYSLPTFTNPTFTIDSGAGEMDVAFNVGDDWATEDGGAMLVYTSRPQSPSINFFKGPYRFAGAIDGAAIPPTSPATLTLPFPIAVGQQAFVRVTVTRADGRLSSTFRGNAVGA